MFCSKCGSNANEGSRYCATCGTKFELIDPPNPSQNQETTSQPLVKKKPMPLWFMIVLLLAIIALMGVTAGILFTESLVDVVDKQLSELRDSNIDKAYFAYTSSEFQKATSLDEFRDFINTYPIFVKNQSSLFTQRALQHNLGTLKGTLTDPEHKKIPVEYRLIKEDGKWRILSIHLLKPEILKSPKNIQELDSTIQNQLKLIKQGQITTAYKQYASKEFQEATSEKEFIDFIHRYPILSHYESIVLNNTFIKNEIGIVSATLQNGTLAYVKYYLIFDNDHWKIWSMRILSSTEGENTNPSPSPVLSIITIGTEIESDGIVKNPNTHFKTTSEPIYVNISIENGVKGEIIHLNFNHLESRTSILTKAVIEENGNSIVMSKFSPPSHGWLKGTYRITATSSSGVDKKSDFSIE